MNTIKYFPSEDRLLVEFQPSKNVRIKKVGDFQLSWDENGSISAMEINSYTKKLKTFERKQGWLHLSGIWSGTKISNKEIKKSRQELLKQLEQGWNEQ